MNVLGIDFDAKKAFFVLVTHADGPLVMARQTLSISDSRDAGQMRTFLTSLRQLLKDMNPHRISIRAKPENGQMRAGPAALKMEGIILAHADVPVEFVSSIKANKEADNPDLFAYQQTAYKAAVVGLKAARA